MGLLIIGVLITLMALYMYGLSVYIVEVKQRVEKLEKAITKCEKCAKDEKSIASDLMKGNDDEHDN